MSSIADEVVTGSDLSHRLVTVAAALMFAVPVAGLAQSSAGSEEWIQLFNGVDLEGWTPKIRYYPLGENFGNTFRVEDGLLTVAYDRYESFDGRFGHLFYNRPFSHYRLRIEYRFIGEQAEGGPEWAIRNSGAMLHSQPPETMQDAQDFPISIEFQLLGAGRR